MQLSEKSGNPAFGLKVAYPELMAIKEAPLLHAKLVELITSYHKKGCSTHNVRRFLATVNALKDDLTKMQMYVSNFILKADGDGVVR